jgi:hypothetical protein
MIGMEAHGLSPGGEPHEKRFVIVPFNYYELPAEERSSIVPICVNRIDNTGSVIAWRLFSEGVVPIADLLRRLARLILKDVWLVSELTEGSVHAVWNTHGGDLGPWPSRLLYKHARRRAEDMRAGGARARRGYDVLLHELAAAIRDQHDFAAKYEAQQRLRALRRELIRRGEDDVNEMIDLILYGCEWKHVAGHLGKSVTPQTVNTIQRRFWRTVTKIARLS